MGNDANNMNIFGLMSLLVSTIRVHKIPILVAKEQERLHKRRKFNLQFIVGQIFIVLEILFSLVFEALFFEFEGSIKLLHI